MVTGEFLPHNKLVGVYKWCKYSVENCFSENNTIFELGKHIQ